MAAPGVETSQHPLGQATFVWRGTVFIADPELGFVLWSSEDLGTRHAVFRDLPGAHDVWVSPDGVLHVWIQTPAGVRVRRIELATARILGDVAPGEVHHGSHQNCAPPRSHSEISLPSREEGLSDDFVPILRSVSSLIVDRSSGNQRFLPGGFTYEFGPWEPDEEGRFAPPIENWLLIREGSTGSIVEPPLPLFSDFSCTIPVGHEGVFVWSRDINHQQAFGMRVGFITRIDGRIPNVPRISVTLNKFSVTPFGEEGTVRFQVVSGAPQSFVVTASRIANTGGHDDDHHDPPDRAFIEFSATGASWLSEMPISPGETIRFRAAQPGIGGRYEIKVLETNNPNNCPAHDQALIDVKVPGLVLLPETGDGYISVGGTCAHHGPVNRPEVIAPCETPNDNHYGKPELIALIQRIGGRWKSFQRIAPILGRIEIGDMSLPLGGHIDHSGDWKVNIDEFSVRGGHWQGGAASVMKIPEGTKINPIFPEWQTGTFIKQIFRKAGLVSGDLLPGSPIFYDPGRFVDEGNHFRVME